MDPEQPSSALLAPTLENLASVKVFPLIPALKKDVTVCAGLVSSYQKEIHISFLRTQLVCLAYSVPCFLIPLTSR